ncbi:MAG TPA: hypothetical protein VF610_13075 [Segetibacter sp.]
MRKDFRWSSNYYLWCFGCVNHCAPSYRASTEMQFGETDNVTDVRFRLLKNKVIAIEECGAIEV